MGKIAKVLKKSLFLLFAVLLLLSGCKKDAYTKIYDQNEIGAKIVSVSLFGDNESVSDNVYAALKKRGISIKKDSAYSIEFNFLRYEKKCNNPLMKSSDTDFDGYARLSLLKEKKMIYMCQKDFKGDAKQYIFDDLMEILFDDMKIRTDEN